jgi:5-methylcytosine-specific restriction protein A
MTMPTSPATFRPPWMPTPVDRRIADDARRGSAHARGYDWRWHKASRGHLRAAPLCVCCLAHGFTVAAELVDHIIPHRGDRGLLWDRGNWQSLCNWCHEHVKKIIELRWINGQVSQAALNLSQGSPLWRPQPLR